MSVIRQGWGDLSSCMPLPPENFDAPSLECTGQLPSTRPARQSFVVASNHIKIGHRRDLDLESDSSTSWYKFCTMFLKIFVYLFGCIGS